MDPEENGVLYIIEFRKIGEKTWAVDMANVHFCKSWALDALGPRMKRFGPGYEGRVAVYQRNETA